MLDVRRKIPLCRPPQFIRLIYHAGTMKRFQIFDNAAFNNAGLNRQAVFNIADLPAEILAPLEAAGYPLASRRQLLLIGHAGRMLWECVKRSGIASEHPIDDFTVEVVRQWFAQCHPQNAYDIVYPGEAAIGLQRLGELAGWHHPTPFMVGIDQEWGTWYAYRALIVADTGFEPTAAIEVAHPCASCDHKICITSCPGAALDGGKFDLGKCLAYRKEEGSACKATCVARVSCPVGSSHRYGDEQIRHTYSISMRAIERYY